VFVQGYMVPRPAAGCGYRGGRSCGCCEACGPAAKACSPARPACSPHGAPRSATAPKPAAAERVPAASAPAARPCCPPPILPPVPRPPPAPFPPTPSSTLEVERLVGDVLSNPVRISVGQLGAANEDVAQRVEVLEGGDGAKRAWLLGRLQVRDAAAAAAAWFLFWGGGAGPCCSCCQRVCRAAGAASIPQTALR
jgi:hypothetical protein